MMNIRINGKEYLVTSMRCGKRKVIDILRGGPKPEIKIDSTPRFPHHPEMEPRPFYYGEPVQCITPEPIIIRDGQSGITAPANPESPSKLE